MGGRHKVDDERKVVVDVEDGDERTCHLPANPNSASDQFGVRARVPILLPSPPTD